MFKQAGGTYAPGSQPGTDANTEAARKRKADAYGRPAGKRMKVADKKKGYSTEGDGHCAEGDSCPT
jgi:hypothetical protein